MCRAISWRWYPTSDSLRDYPIDDLIGNCLLSQEFMMFNVIILGMSVNVVIVFGVLFAGAFFYIATMGLRS